MSKQNILVFPCGSEIGLEIYRSLEYSTHFNLIGASSIKDHGKFVYENYIGNLPFVTDDSFIRTLKKIVKEFQIIAIFPAMDLVMNVLKEYEAELGCKVISSDFETTSICLSKLKTYEKFKNIIKVPRIFQSSDSISAYPVFLKPNIGYGSRGVLKAIDLNEVNNHILKNSDIIIMEYLPGKEFTIDCFTNFKGELLFAGARERKRISNGISVNTKTMPFDEIFYSMAEIINDNLELNGAWFFQVKENQKGDLVLLEIAARLGGSSAVHRAKGINFALLSLFNAFEFPISILENDFDVEMDRALSVVFKIKLKFNNIYVDLDDCLILGNTVNTTLISLLYQFFNEGKKIILITKHDKKIKQTLFKYRLTEIFDEIIQLNKNDMKFKYIKKDSSIFIDDSHSERLQVHQNLGIPVFAPDNLGSLFS